MPWLSRHHKISQTNSRPVFTQKLPLKKNLLIPYWTFSSATEPLIQKKNHRHNSVGFSHPYLTQTKNQAWKVRKKSIFCAFYQLLKLRNCCTWQKYQYLENRETKKKKIFQTYWKQLLAKLQSFSRVRMVIFHQKEVEAETNLHDKITK